MHHVPKVSDTLTHYRCDAEPLLFPEPLREGVVLARPNRFIMDVAFPDGTEERCHCPVVSRIGTLDTVGRPCLVSDSHNPKRKLRCTVEALSLDEPAAPRKQWIGINQNASNRYVEHFLRAGAFDGIVGKPETVTREVKLGSSRLDFLVNDDLYLEVKTPLVQLQLELPSNVGTLPDPPFSSTDRAMRHIQELASSLESHERAVILYCFYYPNPGFRFYHGTTYDEVRATVEACTKAGVELWQANFAQDAQGVKPMEYWQLSEW